MSSPSDVSLTLGQTELLKSVFGLCRHIGRTEFWYSTRGFAKRVRRTPNAVTNDLRALQDCGMVWRRLRRERYRREDGTVGFRVRAYMKVLAYEPHSVRVRARGVMPDRVTPRHWTETVRPLSPQVRVTSQTCAIDSGRNQYNISSSCGAVAPRGCASYASRVGFTTGVEEKPMRPQSETDVVDFLDAKMEGWPTWRAEPPAGSLPPEAPMDHDRCRKVGVRFEKLSEEATDAELMRDVLWSYKTAALQVYGKRLPFPLGKDPMGSRFAKRVLEGARLMAELQLSPYLWCRWWLTMGRDKGRPPMPLVMVFAPGLVRKRTNWFIFANPEATESNLQDHPDDVKVVYEQLLRNREAQERWRRGLTRDAAIRRWGKAYQRTREAELSLHGERANSPFAFYPRLPDRDRRGHLRGQHRTKPYTEDLSHLWRVK